MKESGIGRFVLTCFAITLVLNISVGLVGGGFDWGWAGIFTSIWLGLFEYVLYLYISLFDSIGLLPILIVFGLIAFFGIRQIFFKAKKMDWKYYVLGVVVWESVIIIVLSLFFNLFVGTL
ncbi:MAG: hypothetical protein Q8L29_03785 [archaeon]|nr:hypothetical protein [archaeon]